jgi:hypothetical protein
MGLSRQVPYEFEHKNPFENIQPADAVHFDIGGLRRFLGYEFALL